MPGEGILPQGRETAPLVVEDAAAGAVDRARAEVAEAERRLMQWEKSADTATRATPFPLTTVSYTHLTLPTKRIV